ncbi:transposase family protein [Actinosynnema sp. CA-299493]
MAVTARTLDVAVPCPVCETAAAKVHGYHHRMLKDVPVDGRQVVVHLRARRLVCPARSCLRQIFWKQARLSPEAGHRILCHEGEALTIADTGFMRGAVAECRM